MELLHGCRAVPVTGQPAQVCASFHCRGKSSRSWDWCCCAAAVHVLCNAEIAANTQTFVCCCCREKSGE